MGIMDSINIGESGLYVHGKRVEIAAKNIANIDTPNYVRKIPTISALDDISFSGLLNRMKDETFSTGPLPVQTGGVRLNGVVEDPTQGELMYAPGHPDADKNGYVRRSNVNPMVDMADSILASRAYEANIAVVSISKSLAQKAVEIGR